MGEKIAEKWRMRSVISSEVVINPSEVSYGDFTFRAFEINAGNTEGGEDVPATYRYCDAFMSHDGIEIGEAFSTLYDKLQGFLDRMSFVSYGQTFLRSILSICPASVRPEQEFQIALPQYSVERKTVPVTLDLTLPIAGLSSERERWIRLLRLGLNSASEEDRYISFYSLLEEVARLESQESIKNTCRECGHQVDTGRVATNNFIRDLLLNYSIDQELVKLAPEYRNKIAHGGGTKNRTFYANLAKLSSHLEEVCLIELEKRFSAPIRNRFSAHIVDIPIVTHKAYCEQDGTFTLVQSTQRIPARFVRLPAEESEYANQAAEVGMPLDAGGKPIIDPYSWPDVLRVT